METSETSSISSSKVLPLACLIGIETSLQEASQGFSGKVTRIVTNSGELRTKLLAMGFVAGTEITVVGVAPLGCPIAIETLGYKISLRRSEACGIMVIPTEK